MVVSANCFTLPAGGPVPGIRPSMQGGSADKPDLRPVGRGVPASADGWGYGLHFHYVKERELSLSQAFAQFPKVFTSQTIAIIAAAETGGILQETLERLADSHEARWRQNRSIQSALVYPVLIFFCSAAIVIALLVWVVPAFIGIFHSLKVPVPPLTQLFLSLVQVFSTPRVLLLVLAGGVLAFVLGKQYLTLAETQKVLERLGFRTPGIGRFLRAVVAGQFCQMLADFFRSGVGIIRGIQYASAGIGSVLLKEELEGIVARVAAGEPLSNAVRESPFFPPLVSHLIGVGESTGQLEELLLKGSRYFQEDVLLTLEQLQRLLEPAILFCLGVAVAIFLLVVFLPIYAIIGGIGG